MICSFLTVPLPETYRWAGDVAAGLQGGRSAAGIDGWPTFVSGVVVGALTIISAVVIAWRQRVSQVRDQEVDRAREELREHEHEIYEEKLSKREAWRTDYEATQRLLEHCEELAYHVRHEGPCTKNDLADLGAATLRMNSERLAARGLPQLREPLLRLTRDLDCLAQNAVSDHLALNSSQPSSHALDPVRLHDVQRIAILQDRAAQDLAAHIASNWPVLRDEWGN
jgi:hypothetical protein